MSKKKRNRRPVPTNAVHAPAAPVARHGVGANPVTDERVDAVEPVVDAVLAHAAAMARIEPLEDEFPHEPVVAPTTSAPPAASWAMQESGDIRGVLIQVGGGRLLLPNATIAEVLSYAEPEADGSGMDWMLGKFRWRGWQLPLIAFSRLAGIGDDTPGLGSKVTVLKALGGDLRTPFFAIVTQGFPRLVTVSRSALSVESQDLPLPSGVQAYVRLNDEPALLPDLIQVEQRLRELREAA
ncbi:MAG TPA: chemotaxis protein CheW [Lysobacter sp.]|nr:chemotaxis protein CheW [Lysobacter sp.]